jgi:hypothetical protein
VKAVPIGKVNVDLIWCQNCELWYRRDECSTVDLVSVHSEEHQFTSDYNGRDYYNEHYIQSVWMCADGCYIWDPDDGDVDTPSTWSGVPWACANCENIHINKDDADNCCA